MSTTNQFQFPGRSFPALTRWLKCLLASDSIRNAFSRKLPETRTARWDPLTRGIKMAGRLNLPAVFASGNLLPYAKEVGKLPPQHRWLPGMK